MNVEEKFILCLFEAGEKFAKNNPECAQMFYDFLSLYYIYFKGQPFSKTFIKKFNEYVENATQMAGELNAIFEYMNKNSF